MSAITIFIPRLAKAWAKERPIPLPPPVITATFPSNSFITIHPRNFMLNFIITFLTINNFSH